MMFCRMDVSSLQASLEIEPYLSCLQKTSQCAARVSPRKLFLGSKSCHILNKIYYVPRQIK